MKIAGKIIDVHKRRIYPGIVTISAGRIESITESDESPAQFIMPGLADAHVHIESSMLVPSHFAVAAVRHGTVAVVTDPHEIANVLGKEGVKFMLDNAENVPVKMIFGAPSCVPATASESAGARIGAADIREMLEEGRVKFLAEMMNFPGVIYKDEEVLRKLASAKKHNKPIDGHAPGLMGEDMKAYFDAGITTDHECYGYKEALEKLQHGVKVLIREGSAAKNFETLIPLLKDYPEQMMFCCDDKHPDNLIESHINDHVKRALKHGHDLYNVLRTASYNVVKHYNLSVGLLQEGDNADFIEIDNLQDFNILKTYINGSLVAENGKSFITTEKAPIVNNFNCSLKHASDFKLKNESERIRVIECLDGQLITNELCVNSFSVAGLEESNIEQDILKMAVVNRYSDAPVAKAFIKNVGLKQGAIASCVAHDCHNIVVVGTNDEDMCKAVNLIIKAKGGISLVKGSEEMVLELPIAGIMTNQAAEEVAEAYTKIDRRAKALGSKLRAPYMSLSFMALLVIPELKLSDKGLFNGKRFEFTDVFVK